MEDRNEVIQMVKEELANLTLWCDGSKLDQGGTGAAVVWKRNRQDSEWQTQKTTLSKNKEILDVEIWGISEAVKVAEQKCIRTQQPPEISIFCDSQTAINKLRVMNSKEGQALKAQIYQKAKQLVQQRHQISICWVPSHCGIEGNEKADLAAKEAAGGQRVHIVKWKSLTHLKRRITEEKKVQLSTWHSQMTKKREAQRSGFYFPSLKMQIDLLLGKTNKFYASRFYQLKTGHAAIGIFFQKDRSNRDRQVLVVWRCRSICYASVYKVPKMAHKTPDIKGKPRGSVAKATRKEVVSRAASKHICGRATARVSE